MVFEQAVEITPQMSLLSVFSLAKEKWTPGFDTLLEVAIHDCNIGNPTVALPNQD